MVSIAPACVMVRVTSQGQGPLVLGDPIPGSGYRSFQDAQIQNGAYIAYELFEVIGNGVLQREQSNGVYDATVGTVTREVDASTNGGQPIALQGNGVLRMQFGPRDLKAIDGGILDAVDNADTPAILATIQLLRSSTPGHAPTTLVPGQIAINSADSILYWPDKDGHVQNAHLLDVADIPNLVERVAALEGEVSTLNTEMEQAQADILSLDNRVAALEALGSVVKVTPVASTETLTLDARTKRVIGFAWGGSAGTDSDSPGGAGGNTMVGSFVTALGGTSNGARGAFAVGSGSVTGGSGLTVTIGAGGTAGGGAGSPGVAGGALVVELSA
jgi:hypothetical protein